MNPPKIKTQNNDPTRLVVTSLFVLIWRLGYSWWVKRNRSLTA